MIADLLLHAVPSCMKTDTAPPQGGRRGPAHNYMFPRNIAENIMPVKLIVPSSLPGATAGCAVAVDRSTIPAGGATFQNNGAYCSQSRSTVCACRLPVSRAWLAINF